MVELFETLLLLKGLTMFFSDFSQKRKKIQDCYMYIAETAAILN